MKIFGNVIMEIGRPAHRTFKTNVASLYEIIGCLPEEITQTDSEGNVYLGEAFNDKSNPGRHGPFTLDPLKTSIK